MKAKRKDEVKKKKDLRTKRKSFFGEELVVINVGIRPFYEDLKKQNINVAHVEWSPPAGGDEELVALLDRIL
jgi:hypothetical protein